MPDPGDLVERIHAAIDAAEQTIAASPLVTEGKAGRIEVHLHQARGEAHIRIVVYPKDQAA